MAELDFKKNPKTRFKDVKKMGENPGSNLDEAKKQKGKVIDEKEFKKLVGE